MNKKNKRANNLDIILIEHISEIRKKNNVAWMNILKLAFKENPKEAKKIFQQITNNDIQISKLSKELCE